MSERIYTRCPACQNDTLTINKGRLLCTWHECKDPISIDQADRTIPALKEANYELRNQLTEAQSKADDDWLNRIAIFWKGYTGKQWDVKDGEHREEGIASNLVVIFDEMHALEKERDQLKQKLIACEASRENKKGARNE